MDADMSSAIMYRANLRGADLSGADLSNANLRGADLMGAYVSGPKGWSDELSGPNPSKVNLSGADLTGAKITQEQVDQAKSLKGATMPNGQMYEDWLKSQGRGQDPETTGPS